jgi:AAA15 family ATPase/GTPase
MEVDYMLLEFRAKNFKSFKEEFIFSMTPAPKQKGLDYSVLHQNIGRKEYKGLSSAVIYGPNASGKTNIIGAMDTFKSIVLRGNIRNSDERNSPNAASNALELIPNNADAKHEPISFSIKFTESNTTIEYSLSADVGTFLEEDYPRKIISESLKVNEELIFSRNEELVFGSLKVIKKYLVNEFEENARSAMSLAKSNLDNEELFLMNGFKNMVSAKLVALISNWFEDKFMVIYRADSLQLIRKFADPRKKSIYIEKTLNDAANYFGINSNALGYVVSDDDASDVKLCSIFKETAKGNSAAISAEMFESYGTIRFVNMFPLVVNAILNGGTLVVDEFDASIHPMALMSIINVFHNDDININRAQLIFNTHNPVFLNSNLFRRDEIKFVERDDETHYSKHYSLAYFGTTGEKGVRMHDDYMKYYFVSQYGAIKDIDFTPIFENLIESRKEV